MCEYCGCQAVEAIAILTEEHDAVVNVIGLAREALARGDLAAAADCAVEIRRLLEPHTEVEERALFPAMAGDFPDHIEALTSQHRQIDAVLAEAVDGVPADSSWPARLAEQLRELREHILAEQDGVFPAALSTLSSEQWEDLDRVRARVGRADRAPHPTVST